MKRVLLVALSVLMVLAALASCEVPNQDTTYTITFQNEDGTVLETLTVKEGETPVYTQAEPTKAATDANSYTFAGWDKEIVPADADATYTATFDATEKTYTIRFVDADGSLIDEQTLKFGDTPVYIRPTPTKPADAEFTYTFAGWDKEIAPVAGDTTYTATYSTVKKTYTVIFMNGSVELKNETLEYGATPVAPADPTKDATAEYTYTFTGWDKEIAAVAGDVTYTAQFSQTKNSYTITFKNDDGSVIDTQTVEYGALPQAPTATKASTDTNSYEFKGWDNEVVAVTGDATYTATYTATARKYTITFLDADGTTVLKEEKLEIGQTPTAPADPTKDATAEYTYTFAGWNNEIVAVTGDATYTATYTSATRTYDVVFYAADGKTVLYTDEGVAYGEMPEYKGATPTKIDLGCYEFAGWDFPLEAVNGENLSYIATFHTVYEFKMETVTATGDDGNKLLAVSNSQSVIQGNIQKDIQYLFTLIAGSDEYANRVDYTKREKNLSFTVSFNYAGITLTDLNGNLIATSVKDTAIKLVITSEGKVYANDKLVEGVAMQNGVVSFYINRDATEHKYAQATFSLVEYDVEIKEPEVKNWTALDIDLASGMPGTSTDVTLTDAETALGITSVKEYTFVGWQNAGFASLDLTKYESVKFYLYRPSTNGAGAVYETANGGNAIVYLGDYADTWVEIELRRGTSGYDIYANGAKVTFTLKDGAALTNLSQLAINGNSTTATLKYSNVQVVVAQSNEKWDALDVDLASGMAGTKTDVTLTDTETALGITFAKEYTFASWQNTGFASLDLTPYETVKFYMYRPSTNGGGQIYETANGGNKIVSLDGDKLDTWVEIELRKGTSGYDIYANGEKVTFTLKDGATLTNLNQLALNGSSGTIKYSNVFVISVAE